MTFERLHTANWARAYIAGAPLSSGGTTFSVDDGSLFPEQKTAYTLHNPIEEPRLSSTSKEIVFGTRVGNVLTVTRGEDGTTAKVWAEGTSVNLYPVNANFEKLNDGIQENAIAIITVPGTEKTTPIDADFFTIRDSVTTFTKKTVTRENIKITLGDYFNNLSQTLTNKRITPRVGTTTSSATPTINTDDVDAYSITALAVAITSFTTNLSGTPTDFQKLIIRIKDNGTARAITRGASFEAKGVALPTTTVINKVLTVGFVYDTVSAKWGCIASAQEA